MPYKEENDEFVLRIQWEGPPTRCLLGNIGSKGMTLSNLSLKYWAAIGPPAKPFIFRKCHAVVHLKMLVSLFVFLNKCVDSVYSSSSVHIVYSLQTKQTENT